VDDQFNDFTEHALNALRFAREEAVDLQHGYVGTEHIVLGLLREKDSRAAKLLANFDITQEKMRAVVVERVGRGSRSAPTPESLTSRAQRAIELAADEAHKYGHRLIGTRYLLWGILKEGDGIGVAALAMCGVRLRNVFAEPADTPSDLIQPQAGENVEFSNWVTIPASFLLPNNVRYIPYVAARVSLFCRNVDEMLRFYVQQLGGVVDESRSANGVVVLWLEGPALIMLHDPGTMHNHDDPTIVALPVTHIENTWRFLQRQGCKALPDMAVVTQNKFIALPDPEGRTVRFYERESLQ
jgi:hypothetical protein